MFLELRNHSQAQRGAAGIVLSDALRGCLKCGKFVIKKKVTGREGGIDLPDGIGIDLLLDRTGCKIGGYSYGKNGGDDGDQNQTRP